MADGLYEIRDFSGGLNVLDSEHLIADNQSRIALNVDIKRGAIETTCGYDLFNHDSAKTGGIKMMLPYYGSDGTTKQLIFANDDDYYYLTASSGSSDTWSSIGDYGTAVNSPRGFVYNDIVVLGANHPSNNLKKWVASATNGYLTGGASPTTTLATWNAVTDGSFAISINGTAANITGCDFSGATIDTMGDVAKVIETKLRAVGTGGFTNCTCDFTTRFIITSGTTGSSSAVTVTSAVGSGTDISGAGGTAFMDSDVGNGSQTAGLAAYFSSTTTQPTHKVNIFEFLQGADFAALFAAEEGKNTVYYCDTNDPDTWTGGATGSIVIGKNDGEGIRALKAQGEYLWVIKDTRKYPVQIIYDTTAWIPRVRNATDHSGGTISHDTVKVVVANAGDDLHMLSTQDGVVSFGRNVNFGESPVAFTVSALINPLLDGINWKYADKSRAITFDREYILAFPYGASQNNNSMVVRNLDVLAWTTRDHINVGSMAIFKDSNGFEELYIGDAFEPKIWKRNKDRYDVGNIGYLRKYRTGKISFDRRSSLKDNLKWIDIQGAIKSITNLRVKVIADNIEKEFEITNTNLLETSGGAYIGDQIVGTEYIGGVSVSSSNLRFTAHIDISNIQREFREVELEFYNSGVGEYWKIDYIAFDFLGQRENLPRQSQYILNPLS